MNRLNDAHAMIGLRDRLAGGGHAPVTVDVHQHLWPGQLIEALRSRRTPPRLGGWTLELAGAPDYQVDPRHHDVDLRQEQAAGSRVELALVSLSSPLGIELLPAPESRELLDAYHGGALELPERFGAWAGACLSEVDPDAVAHELSRGFVGLQLPANALADQRGYTRAAPLLDVLEDAGRPLLIHPGPAIAPPDAPAWWSTIVSYVQQMHEAWYAFRAFGRPRHRRLRVCFAMLAGLAPLHGERFLARTGSRTVVDENAFLDVSSYGMRAIDATVRVLGIDVLVYGSDLPYPSPVLPDLGAAALSAICAANPLRLLDQKEVFDAVAVASGAQPR
jgi:6-methylsalicylate decarboxylase